jgi:hypothetical protein
VRTLTEQPTRCKTHPIAHPVTQNQQRKEQRCVRKKEDSAIEKLQADMQKTEEAAHIDMLRQQIRLAELAKTTKQAKTKSIAHTRNNTVAVTSPSMSPQLSPQLSPHMYEPLSLPLLPPPALPSLPAMPTAMNLNEPLPRLHVPTIPVCEQDMPASKEGENNGEKETETDTETDT